MLVLHGLTPAESERRAVALFDQVNALELNFDGKHLRLSLSMGMVPVDSASASVSRLLADAERACDAAKESGRGRWYRFQSDDALLSQMRESANWVRRLDESLQSRGLLLYGQRAVWLGSDATAQPDYIEVLLRMQTSDGVAAPGDFIIAAERYGQIAAVDPLCAAGADTRAAAHRDGRQCAHRLQHLGAQHHRCRLCRRDHRDPAPAAGAAGNAVARS